jgi:hypothetical protein
MDYWAQDFAGGVSSTSRKAGPRTTSYLAKNQSKDLTAVNSSSLTSKTV